MMTNSVFAVLKWGVQIMMTDCICSAEMGCLNHDDKLCICCAEMGCLNHDDKLCICCAEMGCLNHDDRLYLQC